MAERSRTGWLQVRGFFTEQLWPGTRPGRRAGLKDWGKFFVVLGRGFVQNRCWVRAAALSYTTILALVPLLAVVLSVSTAMLKTNDDAVFDYLMKAVSNVVPQITQAPIEEQERMRTTFKEALGKISAGTLGVVGSFLLILTSVSLFSTIERALNDIWGVSKGRSPVMKVVFYWTALTLGSILIFLAIGVTGTLKVPTVVGFLEDHGVLRVLGSLVPYFVLWFGFSMLYVLMPNTRVNLRAAILGGVVAGTLWQLNNNFNALYVSKIVSANKLYGSLGLIPVFLFGLYISWLIVLLGAQVAYTFENAKVLAKEKDEEIEPPNQVSKEHIALRVVLMISRQFLDGKEPLSSSEISTRIGVPLNLVNQIMQRLCDARLLIEVVGETANYEPARPPEKITVADVLHAMRELDGKPQETTKDEDDELVSSVFHKVEKSADEPAQSFDFRKLAESNGGKKS